MLVPGTNLLAVLGVNASDTPNPAGLVGNLVIKYRDGRTVQVPTDSHWEAAMTAGHRKLANLTLIVDRNRLQQGARTEDTVALEPLADKWRAFGWDVEEINGHDHSQLLDVLSAPAAPRQKPLCVIANTFKGQGVSFMRDQVKWHHGVPDAVQFALSMKELEA